MYKWDHFIMSEIYPVLCDICGYRIMPGETYHEEGYSDYPWSPDSENTDMCMSCWELYKEYEEDRLAVESLGYLYEESLWDFAEKIVNRGSFSEKSFQSAMRIVNSKCCYLVNQGVNINYDKCGMCNTKIYGDVACVRSKDTWRYLCDTCRQLYRAVEAATAASAFDTISFQNVWNFIVEHPENPLVKEYKGCVKPVDPEGRAAFRGSYHKIADGTDRCTMCLALIREGEIFTHTDYAKAPPVQLCEVCEDVKEYIDDDGPVNHKQAEEWWSTVIENRDKFDQDTVDAAYRYEDRAAVKYSSEML